MRVCSEDRASKINNSITRVAIFSISLYMYLHRKITTIFNIFWSTFTIIVVILKVLKESVRVQSIMYFIKMYFTLSH